MTEQLELPLGPLAVPHPHAKPLLVSRWPDDGPFQFTWWRHGCDPIGRYFDGTGWCQSAVVYCPKCDLFHPGQSPWVRRTPHGFDAYRCQFLSA